ncbi:MAG: DUF421 domain-containing protein [Bacteroidota bacterium]|nr:DUF421 domain-containing protein [Bacteroidota bacterium]
MEIIHQLFGVGKDLTALQMSMRSVVFFFITLICIRIGGVRAFGKKSAFDNIIVIVLGSVVARGIVGATPFGATTAASFVIVLVHRFLGWLIVKNKIIEKIIKGDHVLLYDRGQMIHANLERTGMSKNDLFESLRLETKTETLDNIEKAYMENNGRISFILKKNDSNG